MAKKHKESDSIEPLSFFVLVTNGLEELETDGHHERVLSGVVGIAEIEIFA